LSLGGCIEVMLALGGLLLEKALIPGGLLLEKALGCRGLLIEAGQHRVHVITSHGGVSLCAFHGAE